MMDRRNIVLVGPMGSGKSTVGQALAMRLGRPHVDTDHFFVARHGSIPEYFAAHGEQAFRAEEERIVAELLDSPRPSVISLGGGSVLSARTRKALQAHTVVMLEMTEEQAALRLGDGATRPMLTRDGGDPVERWKQVRDEREQLYRQCADVVVPPDDATIEQRVDTIVSGLGGDQPDRPRTPIRRSPTR